VGGGAPLSVSDVDLALFVPRVPAYARGNDDLVRFALLQREFNRNEIKFGPVASWRTSRSPTTASRRPVGGDARQEGRERQRHDLPRLVRLPARRVRARVRAANGEPSRVRELVAQYPQITGMPAPLGALRKVVSEREVAVQSFPAEARSASASRSARPSWS
jgi:hypothetical protein